MATTVAQLAVSVTANTQEATQALGALGPLLAGTGPIALGAIALGAAIVGVGVVATKMAGDFQAGMTSLVTGAGESQKNLALVSAGILKMAVDTGTSTSQLISGMYLIESAGYHGAAGLAVLQAAAEGAKVGNADLGTEADAVTTIMKDYGAQHISAAQAVNILTATVANGKTHLQDLASSMSTILPAAAAMHIPLTDIMAALATMTNQGTDAASAATYLRQTLLMLEAPSAAATKALNSVGLTTQQVASMMQTSLPYALQQIQKHVSDTYTQGSAQWTAAMKDIVGGTRSMQGILELTSQTGMTDFFNNTVAITKKMEEGGNSIVGWNLVQDTFNQKMSQAAEVVQTLMIQLGEKLLPVATQLASFFVTNAVPALTSFIKFITGSSQAAEILRPALAVVAVLIGGALVAAFVAWAVAAGAAAVATVAATWPILAIGAVIAGLVAGLIYAYTHWGFFRTAIDNAVDGVKLGITWIGNLIGMLGNLMNAVGKVENSVGSGIGGALSKLIPHFATGGIVSQPTVALVGENEPEAIVPISQLGATGSAVQGLPSGMSSVGGGATGSANGQPLQVVLNIDGRKIAQIVTQLQPGIIRNATGARSF